MLPIAEERIVRKWRLQPGRMFLIDLEQGRIVEDEELEREYAYARPYRQWIDNVRVRLDGIPAQDAAPGLAPATLPPLAASLWLQPGRPAAAAHAHGARAAKEASAPWATMRRWPCSRSAASR